VPGIFLTLIYLHSRGEIFPDPSKRRDVVQEESNDSSAVEPETEGKVPSVISTYEHNLDMFYLPFL
jgi:hypothetical protein